MEQSKAAMKTAFKAWCERNGKRPSTDYEADCARLYKRGGRYILESTHSTTVAYGEMSHTHVGFAYPAGVKGHDMVAMTIWLQAH
jgi:hypothetical protein